jgi:hypothetical protein
MAYQNYSHTAEIVKAALPYFDSRTRPKVEFVGKLLDLMGSLNIFGKESMVACGYEKISVDIEGLLNGIRPLCNTREREFVDRILNIFNIKRMFEMYNNFMNVMNSMQEFGGFPFGNDGTDDNKDDTDTVTGNFTNSNFDSIFQAFMNSSDSSKNDDSKSARNRSDSSSYDNDTSYDSSSYDNDTSYDNSGYNDASGYRKDDPNYSDDITIGKYDEAGYHGYDDSLGSNGDAKDSADSFMDSFHSSKETADNEKSAAPTENQNESSSSKDAMFDMLRAMVPAEQQNTFENLRMLFNTMSYDNNRKSNDSKEHDDG